MKSPDRRCWRDWLNIARLAVDVALLVIELVHLLALCGRRRYAHGGRLEGAADDEECAAAYSGGRASASATRRGARRGHHPGGDDVETVDVERVTAWTPSAPGPGTRPGSSATGA